MSVVQLTPSAVENIKRLQEEFEMPGFGLRFGLTGGGCSGYKYVLELEEAPEEGDQVVEIDGVQVFLNPEHVKLLQNSTIDWVETIMEAGFQIDNPQAKRPCGCGQSVDF
jgi:iron-sulfur cluster assembly protein